MTLNGLGLDGGRPTCIGIGIVVNLQPNRGPFQTFVLKNKSWPICHLGPAQKTSASSELIAFHHFPASSSEAQGAASCPCIFDAHAIAMLDAASIPC